MVFRSMNRKFHGIKGLESSSGNALFVRDDRSHEDLDAMKNRIDQDENSLMRWLGRGMSWGWRQIDYGRSLITPGIYSHESALKVFSDWIH